MSGEGAGPRVSARARELRRSGPEALSPLPRSEQLARKSEVRRQELLDELRVELYAVCSVIADEVVHRARRQRPSYPPYGLVRSMHSQTRMVVADPDPVPAGAIDSFRALGTAYVDTTVFHLHRRLEELRQPGHVWLLGRLEELLALFRLHAGPSGKDRMRDAPSFLYGGLHFGTGVCVQLVEVMDALLSELAAGDRAAVLDRSLRPALRLAGVNVDHVVGAYQHLQARAGRLGWMDPARFLVVRNHGVPWRIDLAHDDLGVPGTPTTYTTLGCPARSSPSGEVSAIAVLWSWCVELARVTGLLGGDAASAG
ncbi:MAG: hypothetical protein M3N11_00775 [Actinomycetota bacterium]|nr:hypothetical protein [Actinomycetota bacterium]